MKKIFSLLLFALVVCFVIDANAQQKYYKYRVGIHYGALGYYGDLSHNFNQLEFLEPGRAISLEKSWSKNVGLRVQYLRGDITHNDRVIGNDGDPIGFDNDDFLRALNFKTELKDINAQFVFYSEQSKSFNKQDFIAPYFGIGLGWSWWDVYGDLFQEDGDRYYYWSDGTIRDLAEDADAGFAGIIEQDGEFETLLSDRQNNREEYNTYALNIPVTLGFKFRLGNRWNLNAETTARYVFSDYVDDVSGRYPTVFMDAEDAYISNPSDFNSVNRGDDNELNDIFYYANFSLNYNFGFKKNSFKAPLFIADKYHTTAPMYKSDEEIEASEEVVFVEDEEVATENKVIVIREIQNADGSVSVIEEERIIGEEGTFDFRTDYETEESSMEEEIEIEVDASEVEAGMRTIKIIKKVVNEDGTVTITEEEKVLPEGEDMIWIEEYKMDSGSEYEQTIELETETEEKRYYIDEETNRIEETPKRRKRIRRKKVKEDGTYKVEEDDSMKQMEKRFEEQSEEMDGLKKEIRSIRKTDRKNERSSELDRINDRIDRVSERPDYNDDELRGEINSLKTELDKMKAAEAAAEAFEKDAELSKNNQFKYYQELNSQFAEMKAEIDRLKSTNSTTVIRENDNSEVNALRAEVQMLRDQLSNNLNQVSGGQLQGIQDQLSELTYKTEYLRQLVNDPPKPDQTIRVIKEPTVVYNTTREKVSIFFLNGDAGLTEQARYDLDKRVISTLQSDNNLKVVLKGYADNSGDSNFNLQLSQQRAEAVRQYILSRGGILDQQIMTSYFGEEHDQANYGAGSRKVDVEWVE